MNEQEIDREREEGRWRTCYWFVEAVRPMLFYSAAITKPFCLCVSIYILFENNNNNNNNNNKYGHYLFGLVKICIYIFGLLFILLLLSLFILYIIVNDCFFVQYKVINY